MPVLIKKHLADYSFYSNGVKKKNYEYGRLSQNHSFSNTDETYVGTPFAALFYTVPQLT